MNENPKAAASAREVDASPFLARSVDSAWARAAKARDEIYNAIEATLAAQGIRALVHRSRDFVYPSWVIMEAWLPVADEATDRVKATIEISPLPHAEYSLEYSVVVEQGKKTKRYGPMFELTPASAAAWATYALRRGDRPAWRMSLVRRFRWEFWLPENKTAGLGFDWGSAGMWILFIAGFLTLGFGIGILLKIGRAHV